MGGWEAPEVTVELLAKYKVIRLYTECVLLPTQPITTGSAEAKKVFCGDGENQGQ